MRNEVECTKFGDDQSGGWADGGVKLYISLLKTLSGYRVCDFIYSPCHK